jgi:hypothetical protein
LTAVSLVVPWTLVVAMLPSGSERRHEEEEEREEEDRDVSLGSLTTTRGPVGRPPVMIVERLSPSDTFVCPSTIWVGTSATGADCTVLGIGDGAHGLS